MASELAPKCPGKVIFPDQIFLLAANVFFWKLFSGLGDTFIDPASAKTNSSEITRD